jgi:hypothetical protein
MALVVDPVLTWQTRAKGKPRSDPSGGAFWKRARNGPEAARLQRLKTPQELPAKVWRCGSCALGRM